MRGPVAQPIAGVDSTDGEQEPLQIRAQQFGGQVPGKASPVSASLPRDGHRMLRPLLVVVGLVIVGVLMTASPLALPGGHQPRATITAASSALHHAPATPRAVRPRRQPKARSAVSTGASKSRSTRGTARTSRRRLRHRARSVSHGRQTDHTRRIARTRPSLSQSRLPKRRNQPAKRVPVVTCARGCIATVRIKPGVFVAMTFRSRRAYTQFIHRRHLFVEMTNALPQAAPSSREPTPSFTGRSHPS